MLSQPLTLNESVITVRDLTDAATPPILPLVDEEDEQTGVVSPPAAPPRRSTSVSSPPAPPCASTSSTDIRLTPMPTPLAPPLPLCPHPVSFHTSSPSSLSPHPLHLSLFSSAPSPTPLYSTSSTPPTSSHSAPFSVSSTSSSFPHDTPLPPLLYHPSPCLVSLPQPPPTSAAFLTPHPSTSSSLSSSSVPPSLTAPPPAVSPLLPPPPHPCCPCASLLPRLLSAHRLEVRRLLRGALSSLGRRIDSLERRSRRRKKGRAHQRGRGACSSASSSCSPTTIPPVTSPPSSLSSSASDSEDSSTPRHSSCFNESDQRTRRRRCGNEEEEEQLRGRKRRRKNRRDFNFTGNRVADQEEESGRFVGRMLVSFRGGGTEDEAPLTLHNFNHRKHMTTDQAAASQSEKAISTIAKQNGYRTHLLLHSISASSHDSLHRVQTCSQPEVLDVSNGQWSFSAFTPPLSFSPNPSALRLWLCSSSSSSASSSSSINPALMLKLSTVAVETVSESVRGKTYECPLRPLKDWTAPPSLKSDHCYVQTSAPSPTFSARRQQKQRSNHTTRSLHLPRRRPLPLPPCAANGLSTPFPAASQSTASTEFSSTSGERVKRVSQIRIRRASPRETPLTPMGLPKIKRLKKKEFSLEEIYTNKNYKSPTTNRSLETIYEEPREKDGALLLIGQQRRRRLLLFPDFTQPRKRKRPQGAGFPVVMAPRKRAAARRHCHGNSDDDADLDVMLVERLSALEDFLTRQGLDV